MELTKKDTKMIQGLSVLAMVCLHLFCRYDYEGLFQPLIFIKGLPLCFYFGQLSDFCVAGFAFCSGYSHAAMFENTDTKSYYKRRLQSLLSLYLNYWLVVCIFAVVGLMIKNSTVPGSLTEFVLNFTSLSNSYNGAWWYMPVYAILVLVSPVLLALNRKMKPGVLFTLSLFMYIVSAYFRSYARIDNRAVSWLAVFGVTLFEYLAGSLAFKTKLFTALSKIDARCNASKKLKILKYSVFFAVYAVMLFFHSLVVGSIAVAPFTGFLIILMFHFTEKPAFVERFFLFIGKHSTNIWLTHMFFYSVFFNRLVYAAKYPVLIFSLMLIITVSLSCILNQILKLKKYLPFLKALNEKENKPCKPSKEPSQPFLRS